MNMKALSQFCKGKISVFLALALGISSIVVIAPTAQAAALTATSKTRLVLSHSTGIYTSLLDQGSQDWFQYYGIGTKSYVADAATGSTLTLTWHVTDGSNAPLAREAVTLILNKSYSWSSAKFNNSGTHIIGMNGDNTNNGGTISGTTDSNGDVTFTVVNEDTSASYSQIALATGDAQNATAMDVIDLYFAVDPTKIEYDRINQGASTGLLGSLSDNGWQSWFQYYGPKTKSYAASAYRGATLSLSWVFKNETGTALANTAVKLIVNKSYSASTANFTYSGGSATGMGNGAGNDGGAVTATTDTNGVATFNLVNTNRDSDGGTIKSQMTARTVAGGDTNSGMDIIDVTFVTGMVPSSETLTAITGVLGTYNDTTLASTFVGNGWYKSGLTTKSHYAYQGSTIGLTYHVVDSSTGTSAAAGSTVLLRINKGYSGSNAKFSSPADVNAAPSWQSADGKVLSGQTDASGNVTFSVTNSDDYCDAPVAPTNLNSNAFSTGGIFTQIALLTGSATNEAITITEIHFVQNPASAKQCVFPPHKADLVLSQASISVDGNEVTCTATPGTLPYEGERLFTEVAYPTGVYRSYALPTQATYYLVYNGVPVWAKSTADTTDKGSEYADYIQTKSATLTSATFSIPKTWNPSNVATVACRIKQSAAYGAAGTSTSSAVILKASGKSKKVKSLAATTNVSMRLVSGFLNKDKSGAPTDYVDFSTDPVKNGWAQYYGPNIGVFYKYFKAGESTTMTWNVTDAVTGAPYALKRVYLIVNKNYGGQENATFVRPGGGLVRANPENWSLQETRIMGVTDPAGNVTFTLKNTNSASQAEPAPEALNKIQPTSVTPLFSTITLTAGLPETQETKDIIWGHITK